MKFKAPARAFKALMIAASEDKTRYYITGVLIEKNRMVATDGHMLGMLDFEGETLNEGDPVIVKIDRKSDFFKGRVCEDAWIFFDAETSVATMHRTNDQSDNPLRVTIFETIDGTYPDYNKVLFKDKPKSRAKSFAFNPVFTRKFSKIGGILKHGKGKCQSIKLTVNGTGPNPDFRDLIPIGVTIDQIPNFTGVFMPVRK